MEVWQIYLSLVHLYPHILNTNINAKNYTDVFAQVKDRSFSFFYLKFKFWNGVAKINYYFKNL